MKKFFKRLGIKHDKRDDLTKKRLQKEVELKPIIFRNGITNYSKIKCTNCSSIFTKFRYEYSIEFKKVLPTCPNCGNDILSSEFLPLDKKDNVII